MEIEIRDIRKKDYAKAIEFAIKGMHFDWYLDSKFMLNLYGRYFWYLEMCRATAIISAYVGDEFAGVLLADMKGEQKKHKSLWKSFYVKVFDFFQRTLFKGSVGEYDKANKLMFDEYLQSNSPDGEIVFLASNPDLKIKGIGSKLLSEFERTHSGKKVFLYTDNACTYQFYDKRGFELASERDVVLEIGGKTVPLRCLLYSKVLG